MPSYQELFESSVESAFSTSKKVAGIPYKILGSIDDSAEALEAAVALVRNTGENIGVAGNSAIVALGIYSGGASALQYKITPDPTAKLLYCLSALFSASAITTGGVAVISRTCQISGTAALSEAAGMSLMFLGNKAHAAALKLENKPIPRRLQRSVFRPGAYDPNGVAFVMPMPLHEVIENLPLHTIGKSVGIVIAVYSYSKLIIAVYRYGQQFVNKWQRIRRSQLIKKQAMFVVVACRKIQSSKLVLQERISCV